MVDCRDVDLRNGALLQREHVHADETALALAFQARGHGAVAFEGHDELLLQIDFDEDHVVLGREPVVGKHMTVTQLVLLARPQHLAQVFVFADG